MQRLVEELK